MDQGASFSPAFFLFYNFLSADERLIDQKHGVVQRTDVGVPGAPPFWVSSSIGFGTDGG